MENKAKVTRAIVDAGRARPSFQVAPSPSIITRYFRDLNTLVRKMTRLVRDRVYPVLEKYATRPVEPGPNGQRVTDDDFGLELINAYRGIEAEFQNLDRWANEIAMNRMMQANHANRKAFVSTWKKTVGVDVAPLLSPSVMVRGRLIDGDSVTPVIQAVRNNVDLIKTIPEFHFKKIKDVIEKGVAAGDDVHSLKKFIEGINGQNTRRAKLIARDQLQKLNGVLVQARQQSIGVKGYIWRTSKDERVRKSHRDNDGKAFQWDSPPRETGHPGEDIQCRCVAEPDLSQIIPAYAPELQAQKQKAGQLGGTLPGVAMRATAKKPVKKLSPQELRTRRVAKSEKTIVKDKFETGIVFDDEGNELLRKKGGKSSVSFTGGEIKMMKGRTLSHNHPGGGNFSPADVGVFAHAQLSEIRAVTDEYVFIIRGKIDPGLTKSFEEAAARARKRAVDDRLFEMKLELKKGRKYSEEEVTREFEEAIHKEYEKLFVDRENVFYERKKRNAKD